jgi:hypothetical protein
MGRAKRKHLPQAAAAAPTDGGEPPLDDSAIEPILHAGLYPYRDDVGNPSLGLTYAVIGGIVLWAIIGVTVVLLI